MSIAAANLSDIRKMVLGMDYKDLCAGIPELSAAPVNGVAASNTFGSSTSAVTVTSNVSGADYNDVYEVSLLDPGEETATESVAVSSSEGVTTIAVTMRSESSTLSTGAEVEAAINDDEEASALVTASDGGEGEMAAADATALDDGVDCTQGSKGIAGFYGTYLYIAVDDYSAPGDTIWRRVSIGSAY